MNIKIIGKNIDKFYERLKESQKHIKDLWNFYPLEKYIEVKIQIKDYFEKLEEMEANFEDKNETFREVLIIKIKNVTSPEFEVLIEEMNRMEEIQYMPLVLLLFEEAPLPEISIDLNKYKRIDPRLIFRCEFSEDPIGINKIDNILFRFCSILNELGEHITFGNDKDNIDLIEQYFRYNLNIICLGRFRQGKSTGVNEILKEYKARESDKPSSQTKKLTYYQVKNEPIKILDIPGFENEESVNNAINELKECGKKINAILNNIHLILYFINYNELGIFSKLEYPILDEILNHKSSKIIYVMTHSKKSIQKDIENKARKIKKINQAIKSFCSSRGKKIEEVEILKATEDNVIFVNFHKNEDSESFGINELFKAMYNCFIQSDDYLKKKEELVTNSIQSHALELRKEAKEALFNNKIWGALIGTIPIVDLMVQKFFIKKNAIKKVGNIFEIDVKFINDSNIEINKKNEPNNINHKEIVKDVKRKNIEINSSSKIKEGLQNLGECSGYYQGANKILEGIKMTNKASELTEKITFLGEKATKLAIEANQYKGKAEATTIIGKIMQKNSPIGMLNYINNYYPSKAAELTNQANKMLTKAASIPSEIASISKDVVDCSSKAKSLSLVGSSFSIGTFVIGSALGAYFTHQFCEELLDKFVDFYIKNTPHIFFSYDKAAQYLHKNSI